MSKRLDYLKAEYGKAIRDLLQELLARDPGDNNLTERAEWLLKVVEELEKEMKTERHKLEYRL